jgi:prophage lp1 protein 66
MKKLLSVLLSLSLVLGLGVTSNDYAETVNTNDLSSFQSLQGDSQYKKPINVKVAKKSKSTSSKSTKKSNAKSKKSNTTKKSTKKTTKKSSTTKKGSTKKNSGATKTTKNNSNSKVGSSTKTKNTSSKNYNADTTQGKIKGNVKSMIYHVPGGAFYDKISVNNVVYFDTEQDAINAGYRKSER